MSLSHHGTGTCCAGLWNNEEEALIMADRLGIKDFAASNGWLESFKKNCNITTMSMAGEAGDVYSETFESWKERSREPSQG